MENSVNKLTKIAKCVAGILIFALLLVILGAFLHAKMYEKPEPVKEVITVSTLEKIIDVNKLSTFTAVYNGVAKVQNAENPQNTDYYVSYEAKVKAGIDFDKISFSVDNSAKTVTVSVPEVYITETNVDIASLDYIFINKKADASAVSREAFKACEADAKLESEQQKAIFELAQQNAENVIKALINPIIEQLDSEYRLIID